MLLLFLVLLLLLVLLNRLLLKLLKLLILLRGGGVQNSERYAVQPAPAHIIDKNEANSMHGCEAVIENVGDATYLVIRPKDGAEEGIISADLKPEEFEAIRDKLKSNNMYGATLKFEGRVYGYGSIAGLFSEIRIDSLGNIGSFDVSNVTDMSYVFGRYRDLKSLVGLG